MEDFENENSHGRFTVNIVKFLLSRLSESKYSSQFYAVLFKDFEDSHLRAKSAVFIPWLVQQNATSENTAI